jgi:hypothetical protein
MVSITSKQHARRASSCYNYSVDTGGTWEKVLPVFKVQSLYVVELDVSLRIHPTRYIHTTRTCISMAETSIPRCRSRLNL